MRTLDLVVSRQCTVAELQRLQFRVRMCDGSIASVHGEKYVVHVPDDELDNLVDTLIGTTGVRQVRTRPQA